MKPKLIYYTVIIFICFCGSLFSNNELQIVAEKQYANKNYKQAIESYETLIKQGYSSCKLHYNLGNAYYKNNEIGLAIYHYELANKLEVNNEDIKNNLRLTNEKTIDKIENSENFFISTLKSGIINFYTTNQWAWISIASLCIALILILIFIFNEILIVKKISFFTACISILFFICSLILGFSALSQKTKISFAIITVHELKIKPEPNDSSKSTFSLHEGTKVKVLETNTEWTNIKLENGNEGWIKTKNLGLIS